MAIDYAQYFDMAVSTARTRIAIDKDRIGLGEPVQEEETRLGNVRYAGFVTHNLLDKVTKMVSCLSNFTDDNEIINDQIPFFYRTGDNRENLGKFAEIRLTTTGSHQFIERLKGFCRDNGLDYEENPLRLNHGMGPHFKILLKDMSIAKLREIYLSEIKKLQAEGLIPPSDDQTQVPHQTK